MTRPVLATNMPATLITSSKSSQGFTKMLRRVVLRSNEDEGEVKTITSPHAEGDDWPKLLTLQAREEAAYFDCLVLCLLYGLENIGFLYPSMSMIVIGHSLLY
jgi:hypothetical protein